jgi:hypothetical protein
MITAAPAGMRTASLDGRSTTTSRSVGSPSSISGSPAWTTVSLSCSTRSTRPSTGERTGMQQRAGAEKYSPSPGSIRAAAPSRPRSGASPCRLRGGDARLVGAQVQPGQFEVACRHRAALEQGLAALQFVPGELQRGLRLFELRLGQIERCLGGALLGLEAGARTGVEKGRIGLLQRGDERPVGFDLVAGLSATHG